MHDALCLPPRFAQAAQRKQSIDADVLAALEWIARVPSEEAMKQREATLRKIEELGQQYWRNGTVEQWVAAADPQIKKVCQTCNGPLLETLLKAAGHEDMRCLSLFQQGVQMSAFIARCSQLAVATRCAHAWCT